MDMTIGTRIKGARLARGEVNASSFARSAGVSKQYLANLENDLVTKPDPNYLVIIARKLDVSTDWLVTGEGLPSRDNKIDPEDQKVLSDLRKLTPRNRSLVIDTMSALLAAQGNP